MNFMRLIGYLLNTRSSQEVPLLEPSFVELATLILRRGGWKIESYSHDRVLFEHRQKGKSYCCSLVDRQNNVVSIAVAGNSLIPDCIYDDVESVQRRAKEKLKFYNFMILNDQRGSVHVITWTGPMSMIADGELGEYLAEMCWNNDVTDGAIRDFYQLWIRNNHHARSQRS